MSGKLVAIASYLSPEEAVLIKNQLEEEKISCIIEGATLVGMAGIYNNAVHGVQVKVWEEDTERSEAILEKIIPIDESQNAVENEWETADSEDVDVAENEEGEEACRDSLVSAREQYARKAMTIAVYGVLFPLLLQFYSAYYLFLAIFSEGKSSKKSVLYFLAATLLDTVFLFFYHTLFRLAFR